MMIFNKDIKNAFENGPFFEKRITCRKAEGSRISLKGLKDTF